MRQKETKRGWVVTALGDGPPQLGSLLWRTKREAKRFYAPANITIRRATLVLDPPKKPKRKGAA